MSRDNRAHEVDVFDDDTRISTDAVPSSRMSTGSLPSGLYACAPDCLDPDGAAASIWHSIFFSASATRTLRA